MHGRIKIHRQIDKRGWRSKPNTFSLFLYLITNANTEEKEYLGHTIKRGDCVVGRKTTSKILGMSEQEMRTSMEHLKSTNEITIKSTNKFSVITVCKWEEYQIENKNQPANQPAHQQTINQQATTPKEYKNIEYNIDESKSQKKLFGKYVAMEEKEYEKLVEKYGAMYIGKKIAALDSYIADGKGKKYKDHYLTINKRSLGDMPEVGSLGEEYLKAIEGKNTAAKTRLENTHSKEKCVREMKTFLAGSFA